MSNLQLKVTSHSQDEELFSLLHGEGATGDDVWLEVDSGLKCCFFKKRIESGFECVYLFYS